LFLALQSQAEIDGTSPGSFTVKEVMDTWTMKTGFPIIRVDRAAPGTGVVFVSQVRGDRFCLAWKF